MSGQADADNFVFAESAPASALVAAAGPSQIRWTSQLTLLLMTKARLHGIHLKTPNGTTKVAQWEAVVEEFFANDLCVQIRTLGGEGAARKLREKYVAEVRRVHTFLETGNKSGKEGPVPPSLLLVKDMDADIAEEESVEANSMYKKRKMTSINSEVLEGGQVLKKACADHTRTGIAALSPFDQLMQNMLSPPVDRSKQNRELTLRCFIIECKFLLSRSA